VTTIRSITVQPNDGSSQTVTAVTPSEGDVAQAGDTLLIIHCNDFYPFANMGTPTVTPTTSLVPVPDGAADAGDRRWSRPAPCCSRGPPRRHR